MIHSSTLKIIVLHLDNFPQNKHITTLSLPTGDTADTCIKSFSFLVLEKKPCTKEADEGKEKRLSLQIPLFFYVAHISWCNPLTGADWSTIETESIAFRS